MPGSPLDLQYPATSDSTYDVLAKFAENFQVLETDLEAKVTQADIEIGGALEMHDHPLTEVGSLLMVDNIGASAVAGTLMYATGKWYVADAVGAIQLTDGAGGINAAGVGGIGGDYGGSDPALVSYSAAASTYSFTTDPGVYADVNMLSVTFQTAGGSLTLEPNSGITGAKTITISAPPASGTGMLTLTSAGVLAANAAVTTAQTFAALTATTVTASGTVSAANLLRTTAKTQAISLPTALLLSTTGLSFMGGVWITSGANSGINCGIPLLFGEKLSAVTVETNRVSAGTTTATLYRRNADYTVTTVASANSATLGAVTLTLTVGSPATLPVGTFYYVIVTPDTASDTSIRNINYTTTIEA